MKTWRGIHIASYGAWAVAVLHGFLAGTDATAVWVRLIDLVAVAAVVIALGLRLRPTPMRTGGRITAPAAPNAVPTGPDAVPAGPDAVPATPSPRTPRPSALVGGPR